MKNIVVIDDQDHALRQVVFEFPGVNKNDFAFRHFDTIAAFRREGIKDLFLVFLDFFLTMDRDYGTTLIPELECEHLVCFSSKKEMSDHMYRLAVQQGGARIHNVYSVQKIKTTIGNKELHDVLLRIFATNQQDSPRTCEKGVESTAGDIPAQDHA
jgi:hypothetical protein